MHPPRLPDGREWDDRGEIAANTAVFAMVVLLVFLCVQFGLWFYGRQVAASAAQHALDAARVEEGTASAGEATGHEYLDQVGGLDTATVAVNRTTDAVTATVAGDPPSILGFFQVGVTVTVTGPVERIVE
ncbi:MAG: TadE family protein [bacterium]